jgi:signal peptidase
MKKFLHILQTICSYGLLLLALCVMIFTIISVSTFDRDDRKFLNYRAYIVLSDSMSATDFSAGDVVFVKEVDPSTLQTGDIIAFQSRNEESYGETVTHKIRSVTTDESGNPGFITYGTTTDTDDHEVVLYEDVKGKYIKSIPKIGRFFNFLKTTQGYICLILIPFLLLIGSQLLNLIRLVAQYREEQKEELAIEKEELALEKEKIEKERAENEKALAELKALKEQMEAAKAEEALS